MKLSKVVFLFSLLGNLNFALAHGEDKPGPNGGYVRMPGAYHTEVIQDGKNKLKVYILDLQFKNPSTDQSKLEISHSSKVKATCEPKENYFQCSFAESVDLSKKGKLTVTSQRKDQVGMVVSYPLPLKFEKPQDSGKASGAHH
jgi:tRNA splicing endonuclease